MHATEQRSDVSQAPPPAATNQDPNIGQVLGKYRLEARLGEGGMGVVYKALDTVLQRRVALKLLHPGQSADAQAFQRFLREAQAAARLNHPHVVAIHEINTAGDVHYLVMELLTGGSTHDRLKVWGPLNWLQATRMIADACRGLRAAHAAGILHRDVKPANLLCGPEGIVKVADFGLVKLTDLTDTTFTSAGRIVGTPHYMSPEQCKGEPLDARSDLYSLGATYFALLTGRPPYQAENALGLQFAHCGSPIPDPRTINRVIPEACAAIVRRALAKEPSERFANAEEMLAALEAVPAGCALPDAEEPSTEVVTPLTRFRWARLAVPLVLSLLVALAGVAIWRLWFTGGAPPDNSQEPLANKAPLKDSDKALARQNQVVFVLPMKDFYHLDYLPVRVPLEKAGLKAKVASWREGLAHPLNVPNKSVPVDLLLPKVDPDQVDAVIFVGGPGVFEFLGTGPGAQDAQDLIRRTHQKKKLVAALCAAPLILSEAGILDHKQATGFRGPLFDLEKKFAQHHIQYVDEPTVLSDRILTGRSPNDAAKFAKDLLAALDLGTDGKPLPGAK